MRGALDRDRKIRERRMLARRVFYRALQHDPRIGDELRARRQPPSAAAFESLPPAVRRIRVRDVRKLRDRVLRSSGEESAPLGLDTVLFWEIYDTLYPAERRSDRYSE